jgi:predicted nucleotidyltransferase
MPHPRSSNSVLIESIDFEKLMQDVHACAAAIGSEHSEVVACILYGSLVKGSYLPDSDIDVLILVEAAQEPFLKRADAFRDFFLSLPMDVDLKVYTGEEAEGMIQEGNPYLLEALQAGKVLWKKPDGDLV